MSLQGRSGRQGCESGDDAGREVFPGVDSLCFPPLLEWEHICLGGRSRETTLVLRWKGLILEPITTVICIMTWGLKNITRESPSLLGRKRPFSSMEVLPRQTLAQKPVLLRGFFSGSVRLNISVYWGQVIRSCMTPQTRDFQLISTEGSSHRETHLLYGDVQLVAASIPKTLPHNKM